MSQFNNQLALDVREIAKNLITEDDEPVDNPFSEKQQRFLVETLYSSWTPATEDSQDEKRKFFAAANVGVFNSVFEPPIVPDVLLSLDVEFKSEWEFKEHRAYFAWEFGKMPDVAIEIVSNTKGGEISQKRNRYEKLRITYYVVFDPFLALSAEKLRVFELGFGSRYRLRDDFVLPEVNLSLQLWRGEYETRTEEWLRWANRDGGLILTGVERARSEAERAAVAEAEIERLKAELARLKN